MLGGRGYLVCYGGGDGGAKKHLSLLLGTADTSITVYTTHPPHFTYTEMYTEAPNGRVRATCHYPVETTLDGTTAQKGQIESKHVHDCCCLSCIMRTSPAKSPAHAFAKTWGLREDTNEG